MQITRFTIDGYRSLDHADVRLAGLTLIRGANGTGKTNLYRSLGLAVAAAAGTLSRQIVSEGGMSSVLWAGQRRRSPRRVTVTVTWEDLRYHLELGLPQTLADDPFAFDPEVKKETIEALSGKRWLGMAERGNATAFMRNDEGTRVVFPFELWRGESMLSQIRDPRAFAIAAEVRERLLSWRLYHQFRTDPESPLRLPQLGVRTPKLAADGSDVAAGLATIWYLGDRAALDRHVDLAFPGSRLHHVVLDSGRFDINMVVPSLNRPLNASELSDGTLRYLCLLVALLSPRPPVLMAFNEPEASLHPDLLAPLAQLLVAGAQESQVWVTTHSAELARHVSETGGDVAAHTLQMRAGATQVGSGFGD